MATLAGRKVLCHCMTVPGHAVLFETEFTMHNHCVGEDSDAVAPLVGHVWNNASQRCVFVHEMFFRSARVDS